jgi:cysteine desulfurase
VPPDLYLDYNGSTPVDPRVAAACRPWLESGFGNPSAGHQQGRRVRAEIERARGMIATAIGAASEEIHFTSGGSEANNAALFEGLKAAGDRRHLLVSSIEHKSVLACAEELARRGVEVELLPVDESGAVSLQDVERALRPDTGLVSVMMSNNETGVVQPVEALGRLCRERGILFHTDAVCTLGKLPIDVARLRCDLLTLGSHKLYAPKGCGVLYVRAGLELEPWIHGCGQERGLRGGTENALAIVGFARACELDRRGELVDPQALALLRDELHDVLRRRFPDACRNGRAPFLPNTLSVAFEGCESSRLQAELDRRGISVSAGASSSTARPSHVLLAMGLGPERARSSLRFSLGAGTTPATIEALALALEEILPACRATFVGRSR